MLKRICLVLVAITIFLSAIACSRGEVPVAGPKGSPTPATAEKLSWQAEWEKTLAAAKQEGEVMIYTTLGGETRADLTRTFREKFGISLEFVTGRGEELAQRLFTERRAGLFGADVILGGGTTLVVVMKPEGVLESVEPLLFLPEVVDPKAWQGNKMPFADKDKTAFGMIAAVQRYVLRNTDMVKEGEITSYNDLLNPKWKGKMVMRDPTITGTGSAMLAHMAAELWDMEKTRQWMREMVKQEPVITRDARMQVEWVARGRYPVGIATRIEDTAAFIREGAPLATVKLREGVKVGPGSGALGVPSRRPHPNATKLFVNWLLTREGQTVFVKGFGNPSARMDVPFTGPPAIFALDPGEKIFLEEEEEILLREKMMEVGREIFGPLMK